MEPTRVLVIAPHPDDEVLGVGGTLARHAQAGAETTVVIVTRGTTPPFEAALIEQGRREAVAVHSVLGVQQAQFLDFPAAALDTVPHRDLNAALASVVAKLRPQVVYVPFSGDIHADHQAVFDSAMVACRPSAPWVPSEILAYETLSETNWNAPYLSPGFHPNQFVDISAQLDLKLRALAMYGSQMRPAPSERSIEAARALAVLRGSTIGRSAAEAFVVVRRLV